MSGPETDIESTLPLDLCIVRPTLGQGGADRVTLTLLHNLDRRQFRPSLVLMRAEGELLDEVPEGVPVYDLASRSLWTAWWPLARHLRRASPRVLLSTSGGANLIAVLARRLSGRQMRLVLSERNVLYRDQGRFKCWLLACLKRWLYPLADRVTAVSEGVRRDLLDRLRLPAQRVTVVYNPVVTPEIEALAAAEPPHQWFARGLPVILGVGRLVPAKGFDVLIDVFAQLQSRRAKLVLLGEGPEREALGRQVRTMGLEDRVWFPGFDPNPFRYMAGCTVFVLPSRFEGLPGVLIQAMACGAAAVATDCPAGPAEILEDGVTGFLVPVDDRAAMVARIDRLMNDADLRNRVGRSAQRAAQRFSLRATLGGYLDALQGNTGCETQ